jgi:glutathione S-transferase
MITVHHLESSRSQRVLWLLEELGVPYEVKRFARDATGRAPKEYRDVHPLGKSPVIRDEDVLLAESGAIVEYLLERHGSGRLAPSPADPARPRYLFWLHFAEGTAMAFIVTGIVLGMTPDGGGPMRRLQKEVQILEYVDGELETGRLLGGGSRQRTDDGLRRRRRRAARRPHEPSGSAGRRGLRARPHIAAPRDRRGGASS